MYRIDSFFLWEKERAREYAGKFFYLFFSIYCYQLVLYCCIFAIERDPNISTCWSLCFGRKVVHVEAVFPSPLLLVCRAFLHDAWQRNSCQSKWFINDTITRTSLWQISLSRVGVWYLFFLFIYVYLLLYCHWKSISFNRGFCAKSVSVLQVEQLPGAMTACGGVELG